MKYYIFEKSFKIRGFTDVSKKKKKSLKKVLTLERSSTIITLAL